ncbi:MAG: Lrp/AsnC ligand binding domain-containing protein [Promethearchaeota archaeon]|jgi:Lrp/AsnC family leucine-responsive transcriptional regulator
MSSGKDRIIAQQFIKNLSGKTKFNASKISYTMGLTRQTYQKRLKILRDRKIISNFTININPNIRPNNLKYVMIEIKTNPKEPEIVEELLTIPHLAMLDGIFGDYSLFALFIFNSPEEYYHTLNLIDGTMAKSYFKKYQIIETIRVFKTNGISLRNLKRGDINVEIKQNSLKKGIKFDNIDFSQIPEIDAIDYEILSILHDGQGLKPISTYEMRNIFKERLKVEISQSTIHNRIKKLEQKEVILNYTVKFSSRNLGFKGKYLLRIKPKDLSKYNELASRLEMNKNITDLFRIGEQYGLLAIVRVKKVEDYGNFIRELYLTEEIEDTFTNFVLDELKPYTNFIIF